MPFSLGSNRRRAHEIRATGRFGRSDRSCRVLMLLPKLGLSTRIPWQHKFLAVPVKRRTRPAAKPPCVTQWNFITTDSPGDDCRNAVMLHLQLCQGPPRLSSNFGRRPYQFFLHASTNCEFHMRTICLTVTRFRHDTVINAKAAPLHPRELALVATLSPRPEPSPDCVDPTAAIEVEAAEFRKPQSFPRQTHQQGAVCCRGARLRFPLLAS